MRKLSPFVSKWGFGLSLFGAFIVLVEFIFFHVILTHSPEPDESDLVVVFAGAKYRIAKGYEIANQCLASYFTISPRNPSQMKILDQMFKKENCFKSLIEDRAQTTFQNALLVGKIIHKEKLTSVLLVTNAVHMPRSYLLLKLQLIGQGIKIIPVPVEKDAFDNSPLKWSTRQKKGVYNEMVELWGSMFEMLLYKFNGKLSEESLKKSKAISFLRSVILFDL